MSADAFKTVLGVDVGGTKVGIGLVREDGTLLASTQYPARPQRAKKWTQKLTQALDAFLLEHRDAPAPVAIGIGIKGSVDHIRQALRHSSVVLGAQKIDIGGMLREHFGLPVFMENDVKAATIAELLYGLGRREKTFACINVGTGLAMGVVCDHSLLHGIHNDAGEIGNLLYERPGAAGEIVCLETVSSGRGIEQEALRLREQYPNSCLFTGVKSPTSRQVIAACRAGDALARETVQNVIHGLAITIINIETMLDLGRYVLVGGVMSDPWMHESLLREIEHIASGIHYTIFGWHAQITVSELGASLSGLCGAGGVAFYALRGSVAPEAAGIERKDS